VSSSDGVRHIARGTIDVSALAAGSYRARVIVRVPGRPEASGDRAFRIVR
jgi:hypothetical protein